MLGGPEFIRVVKGGQLFFSASKGGGDPVWTNLLVSVAQPYFPTFNILLLDVENSAWMQVYTFFWGRLYLLRGHP